MGLSSGLKLPGLGPCGLMLLLSASRVVDGVASVRGRRRQNGSGIFLLTLFAIGQGDTRTSFSVGTVDCTDMDCFNVPSSKRYVQSATPFSDSSLPSPSTQAGSPSPLEFGGASHDMPREARV